jgi:hypothetical protein
MVVGPQIRLATLSVKPRVFVWIVFLLAGQLSLEIMRWSESPLRLYANCSECYDSFVVCGVVIMGFWILPKCLGYIFIWVWDRVRITKMEMEMYRKIGPWHLARVAPSRWSVPCTCSNLGYSRLHQSKLTFFPPRKKNFGRRKMDDRLSA